MHDPITVSIIVSGVALLMSGLLAVLVVATEDRTSHNIQRVEEKLDRVLFALQNNDREDAATATERARGEDIAISVAYERDRVDRITARTSQDALVASEARTLEARKVDVHG